MNYDLFHLNNFMIVVKLFCLIIILYVSRGKTMTAQVVRIYIWQLFLNF